MILSLDVLTREYSPLEGLDSPGVDTGKRTLLLFYPNMPASSLYKQTAQALLPLSSLSSPSTLTWFLFGVYGGCEAFSLEQPGSFFLHQSGLVGEGWRGSIRALGGREGQHQAWHCGLVVVVEGFGGCWPGEVLVSPG